MYLFATYIKFCNNNNNNKPKNQHTKGAKNYNIRVDDGGRLERDCRRQCIIRYILLTWIYIYLVDSWLTWNFFCIAYRNKNKKRIQLTFATNYLLILLLCVNTHNKYAYDSSELLSALIMLKLLKLLIHYCCCCCCFDLLVQLWRLFVEINSKFIHINILMQTNIN